MVRITCLPFAPTILEVSENVARTAEAIEAAMGAGPALVVLPELATSGYVFDSAEEARGAAIRSDDGLLDSWARAAGHGVVVGGFCELGPDGAVYNSAAIVDRSGVVAVYRKIHLWDREKLFFMAGSVEPPVVDTDLARLGTLICYDLEFPEMTRSLALRGAEVIAVPTNWPLIERPLGERPPEVIAAMAAARSSKVVIACCDRMEVERGQEWTEGTSIVNEQGWVAAESHSEPISADIDLAGARDKRLAPRSDAFGDRRPDLYGRITES